MTSPATDRDRVGLAAQRAVYIAFIGNGFSFASWASRIPAVRDALRASPSQLGLILLSVAVGSLIALPLAGVVVTRLGAARAVTITSIGAAAGLVVLGIGYHFGVPLTVLGLLLIGFNIGTWDVSMNVEGAAVEQRLHRAIMPRFHAGFSVGTVAGALGGAAMVALHVPVTVHLAVIAAIVVAVIPRAVRQFLPDETGRTDDTTTVDLPDEPSVAAGASGTRQTLMAWTEPRTLLLGVFVLGMAFTEGTGNDWLAIAVIDGYQTAPVLGPLTFAIFLAAMTAGRWFGPGLLDRYGRVPVLRISAAVALVGLLLFVFGGYLGVAMAGSVLWGLGTALGFPVGMSAAADDPTRSAARVSVVASIGYTAFLAGPPLIGFVGDHVGVLRALVVAAGLLTVSALLAGNTRPLVPPTSPHVSDVPPSTGGGTWDTWGEGGRDQSGM